MIYVDTSVALAHLLAEDRRPASSLWAEPLVSSRLLEYELWNRIHARRLTSSHGEAARLLVGRLALIELAMLYLGRNRRFVGEDAYDALLLNAEPALAVLGPPAYRAPASIENTVAVVQRQ